MYRCHIHLRVDEKTVSDLLQVDRALNLSFTPAQQDDDLPLASAFISYPVQDAPPFWFEPAVLQTNIDVVSTDFDA